MNTDFIYEVKKKLRSKYNLSNHHKMKADFVHEDTDYLTKWFIVTFCQFCSDSCLIQFDFRIIKKKKCLNSGLLFGR